MKVPDGVRKALNVLLCVVAVAGTGFAGREIWQVWDARRQIDAACAGLVPAGRVLALSPAGGTLTHRQAEEGTIELESLPSGQDCELFSTEAGERTGSASGARWFFTGAVGVVPSSERQTPEQPWDPVGDPFGRYTYPAQPLGGGIAGMVTDSGVVVELPCPRGEVNGQRISALWARATLMTGRPFTEREQLTAHDRDVLARTAVGTANNLAERLGCPGRLPDPPDGIPALTPGPTPASRASGTCAWYRAAGFPRDRLLPDQVLESRTDARLWDERCVLVLSRSRASTLWHGHADSLPGVGRPSRPGQWFVALHTYSGEQAKNVHLGTGGSTGSNTRAEPGKAGRDGRQPVWWASSVCAGRAQIHTMTAAYGYDTVAAAELEKLFRGYVDDVTARRGCTDVTLPAPASFRAD
ncbi:hypothetical protein AB0K92_30695 [Streptomyces sp. NPDC052687]|uniref:hypothetical protein n=1 Tax=Streptomyces sp. NPDC052687 TaxID=3154759 RepID=UPI0034358556